MAQCVLMRIKDRARDNSELIELYRAMALTRAFDAKAVALQPTGRLGAYASSLGQEAIGVGAASPMGLTTAPSGRAAGAPDA